MNRPKCGTEMRQRERDSGREVVVMDVCPGCEGIWLDKGELEKLASAERSYYSSRGQDDDDDEGHGGSFGVQHGRGRGRGEFLGGLFGGLDH